MALSTGPEPAPDGRKPTDGLDGLGAALGSAGHIERLGFLDDIQAQAQAFETAAQIWVSAAGAERTACERELARLWHEVGATLRQAGIPLTEPDARPEPQDAPPR